MPEPGDDLWEWSVFWQSDQLQSCLPYNAASVGESLHGTWRAFFDDLADGATILDLGTGNGALATQAVSVSRQRNTPFLIHGVDLADIDPRQFVSSAKELLGDVNFHAQTSMESLPFEDESFDAVVSQYAIEYTDVQTSLNEAMRVLKDGGIFRFLLHADDGIVKTRSALQVAQADIILESDLFAGTDDLLCKLRDAETKRDPESIAAAERAIAALKNVFDEIEKRVAGDEDRSLVDNLFAAVRSLPGMRRSQSLESLQAMNSDIRQLLLAQKKRLQSMQEATIDSVVAAELISYIMAQGGISVSLTAAETGVNSDLVGHWIAGRKGQ